MMAWNWFSKRSAAPVLVMFSKLLLMNSCSETSTSWMATLKSRKSRSNWFCWYSSRSYGLRLNSSHVLKNFFTSASRPSMCLFLASCSNESIDVSNSISFWHRLQKSANFPNTTSASKSNCFGRGRWIAS